VRALFEEALNDVLGAELNSELSILFSWLDWNLP
jgi:hypothetical protein